MLVLLEMRPKLSSVWQRCVETHEALLDCLSKFPADRLHWRPAPAARTAAEIVQHLASAECLYARCVNPQASRSPSFDVPEAQASLVIPATLEDALLQVGEAFSYAFTNVVATSDADLESCAAEDWDPLGPMVQGPLSGLWFVEQMNRHKAYHLGQLWYLATMLE